MNLKLNSIVIAVSVILACSSKPDTASSQTKSDRNQESAQDNQTVVAKVNGEAISLSDLNRRFLPIRYQYLDGLPPKVENNIVGLQKTILDKLIDKRLILQEAGKLKLTVSGQELQAELRRLGDNDEPQSVAERTKDKGWQREVEEELLIKKVLDQRVYNAIRISPEETLAYYKAHMDEFRQPERVRVRQILLGSEWEAQQLWDKLQRKGSFEEAAKNSSLSPDGAQGGDLGYFARGQMPPEFDEVAFSMKKGEISQVFKSDYGYHIFKLEDRKDAYQQPFQEVEDKIRQDLLERERNRVFQEWLGKLRSRTKIEINPYFLKVKK